MHGYPGARSSYCTIKGMHLDSLFCTTLKVTCWQGPVMIENYFQFTLNLSVHKLYAARYTLLIPSYASFCIFHAGSSGPFLLYLILYITNPPKKSLRVSSELC